MKLNWTAYKEIVNKLTIVKFEDACGFECTIEPMEDLVDRSVI